MSEARYTEEETRRWLRFLARGMRKHGQTVFLLEELQPSWLPKKEQRRYFFHCSLVIAILLFLYVPSGFVFVLIGSRGTEAIGPWIKSMVVVLSCIAVLALAPVAAYIAKRWLGKQQIALGLWQNRTKDPASYIRTVGRVGWSFREFSRPFREMEWGWLPPVWLLIFPVVLIEATVAGVQPGKVELSTAPNMGIRLSMWNAFKFLIPAEVLLILRSATGASFDFSLFNSLSTIFCFGIMLPMAARCGGLEVIRHYVLRYRLYRRGDAPFGYVSFLDYAANELGFLQKAGGGYIFMHRHLMEYFADAEQTAPAADRALA